MSSVLTQSEMLDVCDVVDRDTAIERLLQMTSRLFRAGAQSVMMGHTGMTPDNEEQNRQSLEIHTDEELLKMARRHPNASHENA